MACTALVGGLLTLLVFGQEASLYAFVGMFMLMGIVKKNGILIVDFARQRVDAGEAADKAIHDASMDRFRPILMTTLAAVFGALPIALGYGADGSSRRPAGTGCSRRAGRFTVHHALHYAGDLSLPREISGRLPRSVCVLSLGSRASRHASNRG